jgi:amino acid transporter
LAFLGSIPTDMLKNGWHAVKNEFTLPYHDIAVILGLGWLGILTVADAVISPSGTGNIYMTATPRVIYAWSKNGTFFKRFGHIDAKSGIPRPALWLTFALSIFWTLPFPSWETLIGVVSAALVMSYAIAPITCGALRKNAPDLPRPFRVSGIAVMGPLSFIIAALIVFWSGWAVVSWLLSVQIVLYAVYLLFKKYVPTDLVSLKQQIASSIWLIGFYAITILISWLGTFGGGTGKLPEPYDSIIMAVASLGVYYWGVNTGLPKAIIPENEPEED